MADEVRPGPDGDKPRRVDSGLIARRSIWRVPWRGRMAWLSVNRPSGGQASSIVVDGQDVAQMNQSSKESPWVEWPIPGSEPAILVVEMTPGLWHKTIVFVDGVCVDDGVKYEDWRAQGPVPFDLFENSFRGWMWGPRGIQVVGLICASPLLIRYVQNLDPSVLALAVVGFLVVAGWMAVSLVFINWLRTLSDWDDRERRAGVMFFMLGIPILLAVVIANLWPWTR